MKLPFIYISLPFIYKITPNVQKIAIFSGLFIGSVVVSYSLNSSILLKQPNASGNSSIVEAINYKHITSLNAIEANALDRSLAGSFTITAQKSTLHVCNQIPGNTATFTFDYTTVGYDENTVLSISDADEALTNAGVTYAFTAQLGSASSTFTIVVDDIDTVPVGSYTFTVNGVGDGGTGAMDSEIVTLEVDAFLVGTIIPQFPVNGAIGEPIIGTVFSGIPGSDADFFTLQLSKDPAFPFSSLLIDVQVVDADSYVSTITLEYSTIYYWRVKGSNHCDFGRYTPVQSFQTEIFEHSCTNYNGLSDESIPDNGIKTFFVDVTDDFTLSDVNISIDITHQFVGNLTLSLISPLGTEVLLKADEYCGSQPGINVTFDDEALAVYDCETTTSAKPAGSLSSFDSENSVGRWELKVVDDTEGYEGTLNSWSLSLCKAIAGSSTNSVLSPYSDYNFIIGDTGSVLVPEHLTAASAGSTASEQVFIITQLPTYTLLKSGVAFTEIGQTFTQNDINNNLITYNNTSSAAETDTFIVTITNATNGFLGNQVITINLAPEPNLSVNDEFFQKTGISVYPTVSNGNFNIRSSQYVGKTKIELYTFTGLKAYTNEFDFKYNKTQSFSVPLLATGVYILKLTADNLEGSQKLIIK